MKRTVMMTVWGAAALVVPTGVFSARTGQTPATPAAQAGNAAAPGQSKHRPFSDFLIRGTVFMDNGLSFPGVHMRIRRVAEKTFHWETYTNSRGDFAVRVPPGSVYEMVIHAKGFADQSKTIDAKNGLSAENISIRMEPAGGKK